MLLYPSKYIEKCYFSFNASNHHYSRQSILFSLVMAPEHEFSLKLPNDFEGEK